MSYPPSERPSLYRSRPLALITTVGRLCALNVVLAVAAEEL